MRHLWERLPHCHSNVSESVTHKMGNTQNFFKKSLGLFLCLNSILIQMQLGISIKCSGAYTPLLVSWHLRPVYFLWHSNNYNHLLRNIFSCIKMHIVFSLQLRTGFAFMINMCCISQWAILSFGNKTDSCCSIVYCWVGFPWNAYSRCYLERTESWTWCLLFLMIAHLFFQFGYLL